MIRNGHRVNLRKGFWCGNASLCTSLCSLVALVASREARVRGYWSEPREGEGWTPLFFEPFNDREMEEAERLLPILGHCVNR